MFCKNCGQELGQTNEFCSNCGSRREAQVYHQPIYQNNPYNHKSNNEKGWKIATISIVALVVFVGVVVSIYIFTNEAVRKNQIQNTLKEQAQVSDNSHSSINKEQAIELKNENDKLKARLDELSKTIYSRHSENTVYSGGDYFGNSYYLGWEDLNSLSKADIELLRNEIYARNGYVFKEARFANYFSSMSWYYPNYNFKESMFSSIEKDNINTIVEYEQYMNWR